ncbi:SPOR domain-containing protein [Oceanisphaera avium]|uniref:SPOR domain-containing protein n=1 Tax=Oceanisphaera avium TaxID=1903694 RepID=A0A1Y0CVR7_9GAMM|nr:SPOR domain-containing protein [Oceanisphaera avium]ART79440.1 hypothetical protein CBP12_04145 [Oceanisphaera avium]
MATQFQQRLIGTVILVAIGVIFLPDLLSGKKQLVPDEAVTIPLRPELAAPLPAITPPPRPGTEAAGRAAEAAAQVAAATEQLAAQQAAEPAQPTAKPEAKPEVWTIEQTQEAAPVAPKPAPAASQEKPQPAPKAMEQTTTQPKLSAGQVQQIEPKAAPKTSEPKPAAATQGQFIVQLGAFKNAANVNALVQKLKAAGYNAQTTPSPAREGEINRVWIGPDSKARLEQQLPALQRLTGLSGSVRAK